MPSHVSDALEISDDGEINKVGIEEKYFYRGYDKKTHSAANPFYGNFSLWDTFRTVHPLYNLIAKKEQTDMIASLLEIAKQSGRVPRWGGQAGHSDSMLGFPGHIAISESFLKGIPLNEAEAFQLMTQIQKPFLNLDKGQECLEDYATLGFCPLEYGKGSLSYSMEYAYSDFALSLMAAKLNLEQESQFYRQRSERVLNHWNSQERIFAPKKRSHSFAANLSPMDNSYLPLGEGGKSLFEGSLLQWRWYIPYSKELFLRTTDSQTISDLDAFFKNSRQSTGSMYPGGNYWHGNEPGLHSVYLFNWLGRPDLTQHWVRWLLAHKYANHPKGLDGEDDAGTLSAWYVWSALGLYPIAGTSKYFIGSPSIQNATLQLADQKLLKIIVQSEDPRWVYVSSVTLNGKPLNTTEIDHDDIKNGGELVFQMAAQPHSWGQTP
jgi:predicted alpha-1,2-mannosidase